MNSERVKQLIPLYIENELEPNEAQLVREFLQKDPALKAYSDEMQKAWQLLDGIEILKPSPSFVSDFWTKLSEEKTWQEKISVKLYLKKWGAVLASLCAILLVLGYIQTYQTNKNTLQLTENTDFSADDIEFFENYELAENLDIIEDIDFLEDMEILEQLEELEISYAT